MAQENWNDIARMAQSGLLIASAAAPVGLICLILSSWRNAKPQPRYLPFRLRCGGLELVPIFLVVNALLPALAYQLMSQFPIPQLIVESPPATPWTPETKSTPDKIVQALGKDQERANATRSLWVGVSTFPVQLIALLAAWRFLDRRFPLLSQGRDRLKLIAIAVATWAILTPLVLLVHFCVNQIFMANGWVIDEHPLSKFTQSQPAIERVLFVVLATVIAPILEEIFFRGFLLGWLIGGTSFLDTLLTPQQKQRFSDRRSGLLFMIVLVAALMTARNDGDAALLLRGPILFSLALPPVYTVLRFTTRKRRTLGAIFASAALFAAIHSSVWPSPLPLFVLGLGLGWLAIRTRGVLAPIIVHGLFNLVSVLFVLQS